jgi:hypothetical protein
VQLKVPYNLYIGIQLVDLFESSGLASFWKLWEFTFGNSLANQKHTLLKNWLGYHQTLL